MRHAFCQVVFIGAHSVHAKFKVHVHILCVFLSVSKNLYEGGDEKQEINLAWPKFKRSLLALETAGSLGRFS